MMTTVGKFATLPESRLSKQIAAKTIPRPMKKRLKSKLRKMT